MWRFNKVLVLAFALTSPWIVSSQSKGIVLKGIVKDASLNTPLKNTRVIIVENKDDFTTNIKGEFSFLIPKAGEYHLTIAHIDCETKKIHLDISKDTFINVYLEHYHKNIEEITVKGSSTSIADVISEKKIEENANQNLSTLLENSSGVQSLRNGSGIAKPVVQGLYGNRLSILNNGIAQSGQQWGNDHAPEIDPLSANKIKVVKGVSTLEYKGVNMGAIVLIEPEKIGTDPHIHGKINSYYETNGRGFGLHFQTEKFHPNLAWKFTGTYKKSGDKSTPNYYLRNTGVEELNFSVQLEKTLFNGWKTSAYISSFNSELGVLRGSHIGNLTDLQNAFQRDVPFFTEPDFSYRIDPPRQSVNHHLWKLNTSKILDSQQSIVLTYAGQLNSRREYDIRRGGRSEIPALYILQYTNFLEAKYIKTTEKSKTKLGVQFNYIENINQPETGITPLIPNYNSIEPSLFFTKLFYFPHATFDIGIRNDLFFQNIYTTTTTFPKENRVYSHIFNNPSASLGYNYSFSQHTTIKLNSGFSIRNPAINELYSFGLHQGISSIEEGNSSLISEKSFKTSLNFSTHWKERLFFELTSYFHNINDYIFLEPQEELRLTIRGAFPVFIYKQTHAQIYGFELSSTINITDHIKLKSNYSFLRGWNLTQNNPLVFMPANSWNNRLEFVLGKWGKFETIAFELDGKYTFRQNNLENYQDYLPAPDGYFLIGGKLRMERQIQFLRSSVYLKIDNVLNTQYRDYLNRLRYFADELGLNVVLGLNVSF